MKKNRSMSTGALALCLAIFCTTAQSERIKLEKREVTMDDVLYFIGARAHSFMVPVNETTKQFGVNVIAYENGKPIAFAGGQSSEIELGASQNVTVIYKPEGDSIVFTIRIGSTYSKTVLKLPSTQHPNLYFNELEMDPKGRIELGHHVPEGAYLKTPPSEYDVSINGGGLVVALDIYQKP